MSEHITTPEALGALPPDDARTAWEREALDRFLRSSPDIPPHIFKHFEVAMWGACHVLLLMRPDRPSDLAAEAAHTEWGVRYTAPHPEPDRRYPVPSEQQARMLADDPDGRAVAVLREVSYGPWRDAQPEGGAR